MSYLEYDYPLLAPLENLENIQVASLKDLACIKLDAIASRSTKRDFIDLYAIIQKGHSLQEVMLWFAKKYQSIQYNQMHLLKSLTYFADADPEPSPIMLIPLEWPRVKTFFEQEAKKLV